MLTQPGCEFYTHLPLARRRGARQRRDAGHQAAVTGTGTGGEPAQEPQPTLWERLRLPSVPVLSRRGSLSSVGDHVLWEQ